MKIIRKGFPTGTHPAAVVDYPNSPALALKKKDQMYSIENRNLGAGRTNCIQVSKIFETFPIWSEGGKGVEHAYPGQWLAPIFPSYGPQYSKLTITKKGPSRILEYL